MCTTPVEKPLPRVGSKPGLETLFKVADWWHGSRFPSAVLWFALPVAIRDGGPTGLSCVGPRSFYSPRRPADRCRAVVILVCGGGRVVRTFTGAVDDDAGTQPPAS